MPTEEDVEWMDEFKKFAAQEASKADQASLNEIRRQLQERSEQHLIKCAASRRKSNDGYVDQLRQLFNGATWDGDLIGKSHRDELIKSGLAERAKGGYNIITKKGVEYLVDLGLVHPK